MKRMMRAGAWLALPILPVFMLAGHALGRLLGLRRPRY